MSPSASPFSKKGSAWQAFRHCFEGLREAFWRKKLLIGEQCQSLRAQANRLEQEHLLYEQERLHLWEDIQAQWQFCDKHERQLHGLQERMKRSQAFLDALRQQRDTFKDSQQIFQDKLCILREKRRTLRDMPDLAQRQQALQQLQTEFLHLQQGLRDQLQCLREQKATYRQRRLDYQAAQMLLRAEKTARKQRQEERRWQGYGYSHGS